MQIFLHLGYRHLPVMENRSGKASVCLSLRKAVVEVRKLPNPARGDYRDINSVRDRGGNGEVKAVFDAVGLHTRQQDFSCSAGYRILCPLHRIKPCPVTAAVDDDLILELTGFIGKRRNAVLHGIMPADIFG